MPEVYYWLSYTENTPGFDSTGKLVVDKKEHRTFRAYQDYNAATESLMAFALRAGTEDLRFVDPDSVNWEEHIYRYEP